MSQSKRFDAESELAQTKQAREEDQDEAAARKQQLNEYLNDVESQRDKIVRAVKQAYQNASNQIEEIVESLSSEGAPPIALDPKRLEELVAEIESLKPRQLAKYLLAYEEIRKRCDIWEIHIDDQEIVRVTTGDRTTPLRISSAENFENQVFNLYKSLPQSKGLVIILVSYGDVRASLRQLVITALPEVTDRMREDAVGRTRFEYAVIGYLPETTDAETN